MAMGAKAKKRNRFLWITRIIVSRSLKLSSQTVEHIAPSSRFRASFLGPIGTLVGTAAGGVLGALSRPESFDTHEKEKEEIYETAAQRALLLPCNPSSGWTGPESWVKSSTR